MSALRDRLGFAPGKVLRVFGMRRSGNHAITGWLARNAPGSGSVFLNNCSVARDPLSTFRTIEVNGAHGPAGRARDNLSAHTSPATDGALLMFSYEDSSPAEGLRGRPISGPFEESLVDHDVIIYRSFLNWSASLLRKMQGNPAFSLVRRNAVLLRAIDTYSRVLGLVGQETAPGLIPVCYDNWYANPSYRADRLARIGLEARDNTLGAVQSYGGGSSFQKDATRADDLATGSRWAQMADDPEYRAILALSVLDPVLMAQLDALFPQDAAQLRALTAGGLA